MESQDNKAQVMAMFSQQYDARVTSQEGQTNAYEYERSFDEFMQQMGRELLQHSVGEETKRLKKKPTAPRRQSRYSQLSLPHRHVLCQTPEGFSMTSYWQEQCL